MTIGQRITKYRKEEKISQEKLAEILGIARQTLSNYENDITLPDLSISEKISKKLNISLDELVGNSNLLYNRIRHTDNLVKKQSKILMIICISIYSILLSISIICLIYFLLNKDYASYYQPEIECYNKKTNEYVSLDITGYQKPYTVYNLMGDEETIMGGAYFLSQSNSNINIGNVYLGDTFKEALDNFDIVKKALIYQGFTCKQSK